MPTPRELKDMPKGGVVNRASAPTREEGVPTLTPLAGPTPRGEVVGAQPITTAPGSNRKPR